MENPEVSIGSDEVHRTPGGSTYGPARSNYSPFVDDYFAPPWTFTPFQSTEYIEFQLQSLNRRYRWPFLVLGGLSAVIGTGLAFVPGQSTQHYIGYGLLIVGFLIIFFSHWLVETRRANLELEKQFSARQEQATPVTTTDTAATSQDYFERLVRINIENLRSYYALVKRQADNSFLVSLLVAMLGFALMAAGLVIGFVEDTESQRTVGYVATGAGITTEFISSVFFYLYNRTARQLKEYHDSLIDVQNILLSFRIVDGVRTRDKIGMLERLLEFILVGSKRTSSSLHGDSPTQ